MEANEALDRIAIDHVYKAGKESLSPEFFEDLEQCLIAMARTRGLPELADLMDVNKKGKL